MKKSAKQQSTKKSRFDEIRNQLGLPPTIQPRAASYLDDFAIAHEIACQLAGEEPGEHGLGSPRLAAIEGQVLNFLAMRLPAIHAADHLTARGQALSADRKREWLARFMDELRQIQRTELSDSARALAKTLIPPCPQDYILVQEKEEEFRALLDQVCPFSCTPAHLCELIDLAPSAFWHGWLRGVMESRSYEKTLHNWPPEKGTQIR